MMLLNKPVFEKHLKCIIKSCRELIPGLQSIILYGGFGRDEGSWYQDEQGEWRPYNDYDICIVTKKKASLGDIKKLKTKLAREIGINWIDLGQFLPEELSRLRPSILNYDFKNASKVICGDSSVLDLIPEINASTLPMKDAQILFFTRLYTLLGSLDKKGVEQEVKENKSRFFRNQMAKAILAIVDVMLLAKGAYDSSYKKRVDRMAALYPAKKDFLMISRWALEEKLYPTAPNMNPDEVRALYHKVYSYYFSEMYGALSKYFKRPVKGPEDVEFCMKWKPLPFLKRLFWVVRFSGLKMEKQIATLIAQNYIADAWNSGDIKKRYLQRGINLLKVVDSQLSVDMNWDEARLQAARLRMKD